VTSAADLLSPAQTNLRLYEELRQAGRDPAEIVAVRRAYDLAARLFAGQYRASGKPFVAHLVGVASILGRLGERGALVVAGILHAAYDQGIFPGWRRRVTEAKRAAVRAVAGEEAERLVIGYHRHVEDDRDVVVMRLANELEDLVDLAGAYSAKPFDQAERAAALATELGHPSLAEALTRAARDNRGADLPAGLASSRHRSFLVEPATHREKIELRAGRRLAALWKKLR
jgi:HD domain